MFNDTTIKRKLDSKNTLQILTEVNNTDVYNDTLY